MILLGADPLLVVGIYYINNFAVIEKVCKSTEAAREALGDSINKKLYVWKKYLTLWIYINRDVPNKVSR